MEEKVLFELGSVHRDNMRVKGYYFGSGEHSVCIVGATRDSTGVYMFKADLCL